MRTLRLDDTGPDVLLLQRLLAAGGFATPPEMYGWFNAATEAALGRWQERWGLTVDGVCGRETWNSFRWEIPIQHLAGPAHRLTKNFTLGEFACNHCWVVRLRHLPALADALQQLRNDFRRPVSINSGHRCPAWNREVGGDNESFHLWSRAADVHVWGVHPSAVAEWAVNNLSGGVGLYTTFVHLDTGPKRYFRGAY